MLKSVITSIVRACTRHAWLVIGVSIAAAALSGLYTARNFAINTNVETLIADDVEWRKREVEFEKIFPNRYGTILVVVDAPTPELVGQATVALRQRLEQLPKVFTAVRQPDGGDFFTRNGLLFLPTDQVKSTTEQLDQAGPLITILASDPSLRGLGQALGLGLQGVQRGQLQLDNMTRVLNGARETIDDVLAGRPAHFSWRELISGKPSQPNELRKFIEVRPVLDFAALEPGKAGTDAIRNAVSELKLAETYGARVRLTGPVPIADDEFGTLKEGALLNGVITLALVGLILWLALHSGRVIVAVAINLFVGLALTAAAGLLMVGAFNLISIAFAVLFVGLGVDFGIQFAVRYRSERFKEGDLRAALVSAAEKAGAPLTLAAAAVAAGFLSFLPTEYKGVSELGLIAGVGMLIAYATSISLLPALLVILHPSGEEEPVGYAALAPVDRFLERHRVGVLATTGIIAVAGLPLLYHLTFDFNPLNLRSPNVESVATYLDLRNDPLTGASAVNVVEASPQAAAATAEKIAKLPEVDRVMTANSLVPTDQEAKLGFIREAEKNLAPDLKPESPEPPPTDAENVTEIRNTAANLTRTAGQSQGAGADAARALAASLTRLADASAQVREKAQTVFVSPLKTVLGDLRSLLGAEPVTLETLPADLVGDWVNKAGQARVQVTPKGDPNDNEVLRHFARAVLVAAPGAIGGPITILQSGETIVRAFFVAGALALVSIAILLWLTLHRIGDVALTLVPLLLAGVVTLEICVLIGMPLNFANIIALPLLLGIGVAFKIYYIMAWRAGRTNLLQSSLTRAVFWSSLTTATAFGSLWFSSHPGTSSMGKLLALSLVTTMFAAVLFQPALMGKPRDPSDVQPSDDAAKPG